jgi:hypothetical protein
MSFEEGQQIVASVEETYALMGVSLGTTVDSNLIYSGVRPEVLQQLANASIDPYIINPEMRELLLVAYNDLVETSSTSGARTLQATTTSEKVSSGRRAFMTSHSVSPVKCGVAALTVWQSIDLQLDLPEGSDNLSSRRARW